MSYGLKNPGISSTAFTPLSEEEFDRLRRSVNNLWIILSIEEQLDLVIENYLDLENDLLSMATRMMVFTTPKYGHLAQERNLVVNRRLLNLLNSCRGYLDHTPHHLSSGIQGHEAQRGSACLADFKKFTTDEYDTFLGYRAMEAMRNYTQHAGFPLAVTWGRGRAGEDPDCKIAYSAIPWIEVNRLGKSFKPARVRRELEDCGGRVEVMPLGRQYVASLGNIHERTRKLLRPCIEEWEKNVFELRERFRRNIRMKHSAHY